MCIPSASNFQTYYMLHSVLRAEVRMKGKASVVLAVQGLLAELVMAVAEPGTGPTEEQWKSFPPVGGT